MRTVRKIVNKARHWHSHGKHKGLLIVSIMRNRGSKPLRNPKPEPMFDSVPEMMLHYAKRK